MCWIAGQNPQRVVAPIEEEEEDVLDECIYFMLVMEHIGTNKVKLVAIQARTFNLYVDVLDECIYFIIPLLIPT